MLEAEQLELVGEPQVLVVGTAARPRPGDRPRGTGARILTRVPLELRVALDPDPDLGVCPDRKGQLPLRHELERLDDSFYGYRYEVEVNREASPKPSQAQAEQKESK